MRTLHVFDPRLVDYSGHYANYCAQIVREMSRRGIQVRLYGRKGCSVVCEGVTPEPVFSHDVFVEVGRDPEVWAIENFNAVNQAFAADLYRIPASRFSAEDIVFFPTILQNQIHAVGIWLSKIPAERRPAASILFRYLNRDLPIYRSRSNAELINLYYRYACRNLLNVQPRTVLAADTREMAAAFASITGHPVSELTIAMEPPSPGTSGGTERSGRPVVAFLGHTSQLKGFHFLPEIVHRNLSRTPRPRFLIQVQDRAAAMKGALRPAVELLERFSSADVELLTGALNPSAYYGALERADIVVLPYSPEYYGTCSSGVFAEAAVLGKAIVAPAGTVSARQAAEYNLGASIAPHWTATDLSSAVGAAIADLPGLREKSSAAAARFRAEQSVQSFWDRLFADLAKQSAGRAEPAVV